MSVGKVYFFFFASFVDWRKKEKGMLIIFTITFDTSGLFLLSIFYLNVFQCDCAMG